MIPGERIIELAMEIALEAMKGQPPEVKATLWRWYVDDMTRLRVLFKLDKEA